jgi:hypothetical protein
MPADASVLSGARQLVSRCLGLEPNQQLVVFCDEATVEPAIVIAEAAEDQGVSQAVLLVPKAVQRRIPSKADLSVLAQGAAREARAILTCVNAAPDCLPFRQRILETHWTARTRIGHMPGANLNVLKLADVDFEKLVSDCWCMEVAMARGNVLELISYAADGAEHTLTANIGGWDRLPVASDGVINDGAWGNVPSGETYVAPMEGSGEGSIVINGSLPGMIIEKSTELILRFEDGRLVHMDPPDSPVAHWLHKTQIARARATGDLNWANLAEVGVGMNPAVKRLTGNMLFDEKAAGTAHIALGANIFMGGAVQASIHCDMVTRKPSLRIDGKGVVDGGRLTYRDEEWHDSHTRVRLRESPMREAIWVARSGIQAGTTHNGRLQRILRPEPGRVSACFVGDPETAQIARSIYRWIPDEWVVIDDLGDRVQLGLQALRRVLDILWRYDLIKYR